MNRRMKVCLVHNTISPYRLPLFDQIAAEVDLTVLFCKPKESYRKWETDLGKYSFDYTVLENYRIGPFVFNPKIYSVLKTIDADAYVIGEDTMNLPTTVATIIRAIEESKPILLWSGALRHEHSYKTSIPKRVLFALYKAFQSAYRRLIYRFPRRFVTYSSKSFQYLTDRGVDPEAISVGGQVVPPSQLPEPPLSQSRDECETILYLGYLQRRKGVRTLIDAYEGLSDRETTELVICGDGPQRERLQERVPERDVQFPGYVRDEEKAKWYDRADVLVLPTLHDPWGLVVNEALYYSTPVITTNRAGAADLVSRSGCGLVVPANDSESLRIAIERVLDENERFTRRAADTCSGTDLFSATTLFLDELQKLQRG